MQRTGAQRFRRSLIAGPAWPAWSRQHCAAAEAQGKPACASMYAAVSNEDACTTCHSAPADRVLHLAASRRCRESCGYALAPLPWPARRHHIASCATLEPAINERMSTQHNRRHICTLLRTVPCCDAHSRVATKTQAQPAQSRTVMFSLPDACMQPSASQVLV